MSPVRFRLAPLDMHIRRPAEWLVFLISVTWAGPWGSGLLGLIRLAVGSMILDMSNILGATPSEIAHGKAMC